MCFILCTYGISVCTSGCILQIFDDVSKIATVGLQTEARSSPEDMQQVNRDIFDSGTLGIPVERDFSCDIYSNEAVTDKSQITVISHQIFSNRIMLHKFWMQFYIRLLWQLPSEAKRATAEAEQEQGDCGQMVVEHG